MLNLPRLTVLIVDDEPAILSALERLLRREFDLLLAGSAAAGLELLRQHEAQIVISDQRMPVMSGAELLARVARDYPDTVRLLLTGYADLDAVISAINEGAIYRYLLKPWDAAELRSTVRQAAQQHLLVSQNRRLLAAVIAAQESERTRIARELHDDIGQNLTALLLALGAVQGSIDPAAESEQQIIEDATVLAENMMNDVRRLIADLRPAVLDSLGLAPALRRLGSELERRSGVAIQVEVRQPDVRFAPQLETTLFRVAQEALANIARHAGATHASIMLGKDEQLVWLEVEDNGRGMQWGDTAQAAVLAHEGHFGLLGMQERVALLAGSMHVQSAPGQGTRIRIELPLASQD